MIICQTCDCTIEHYKSDKVATLYSSCTACKNKRKKK
ncbi:GapA-binding peptide SR1P [Geomicrobium sp. JCM 19039]|nr:GapA-binding peptide SR1P [Geomicrobium sp. JCM 19039]